MNNDQQEQLDALKTALYTIAGPHVPSGLDAEFIENDDPNRVCVYCDTPFPCFTVRVARRAAADWFNG